MQPDKQPPQADGDARPSALRLAFSKAADIVRIGRLFKPEIKSKIDPQGYVVKRDKQVFEHTISRGGAAFLYDTATGHVVTLTMAYEVKDPQDSSHKHTEIGTSLASLGGFKSAQLVVAAMALKEWWDNNPQRMIVTEILPTNGPSLHLYRDTLNWEEVKDEGDIDELFDLCNEYIDPEDQGRDAVWFFCSQNVLPVLARTLLDAMDAGALHNKRTGENIPVDMTALDQIGLTRKVLEQIAKGVLDKSQLRANTPPPPAPPAP